MKCFDQVSYFKIAFLQKIRRFQGQFKCKSLFYDKIRHFYAKRDQKNLVSNYKITIILKIRVFQGKFQCLPLFFDIIRYIHERNVIL